MQEEIIPDLNNVQVEAKENVTGLNQDSQIKPEPPQETKKVTSKPEPRPQYVDLAKGKEKTIEDAAKQIANNDIKVVQKKPVYKSVTVATSLMSILGALILCSSLLVKPAEQLIEHGHLKWMQLIPGIAYFVILQGFVLYGRIRKGDLTAG